MVYGKIKQKGYIKGENIMFYFKERISDSIEVFADGKGDLYSTSIYCSECSKKIKANCGCK